MATLYTEQSKNVYKTWVLIASFFGVIIALGFVFSQYYDNPIILYVAFGFSLLMNIGSYWYSDKMALHLHHARSVTRQENMSLWNTVENLSITAGLPMPKLYVIDDLAPNAFATGRNKEHAALAVTTGLLAMLSKDELEGVIAHELAHIGNRDILLSTIVVVLVGFISIVADFFLRSNLHGSNRNRGGGLIVILTIVLSIMAPIFASLIHLAISRKREFLADATGALLTRYPQGLANALFKISKYSGAMNTPHQATAHLFISNPFGGKNLGKKISGLFSTHPRVEDRVKALIG